MRVFVVAPMRERLERVIAEQDVDADHARRVVEQEDRESAEYLRYLFGINWLDPHEWDLMVNSGQAHMDATLDMLAEYVAGLQRSDAEREALERVQLASRLEQVLLADEDLGVDHVRVRLEGGTVVLEGQALSEQDRERAESAARATAPGAALDNRIVVHPPASV